MNLLKFALTLAIPLVFTLSGCAPRYQQQTVGETNARYLKDAWDRANAESNICLEKIKKVAAYQTVYKEVLFLNPDSPNKIELMSSSAKISPAQSKALLDSIQLANPCRQDTLRILSGYPQLTAVYSNYFGSMDIIYADLLSKRITIGEANKQKALLIEKVTAERSAVAKSMWDSYQNQDFRERQIQAQAAQVEATNNAARTAIASQYLQNMSNQQSNMTQYYQNQSQNYINQMNSAPRQAPYLNAPQQQTIQPSVNCVPNGVGGFRCQ